MNEPVPHPTSPMGNLRFPMLLRHVPPSRLRLARNAVGWVSACERLTWWELVDAAGDEAQLPAGVAVTCMPGGSAGDVVLEALAGRDPTVLGRLAGELVVALRRSGAETLIAPVASASPAATALRAVGLGDGSPPGSVRRGTGSTLLVLAL